MTIYRPNALLLTLAVVVCTVAATPSGPMTPVRQFVSGFNAGNAKLMLATCAEATGIIDDFPPHAWMSCAEWYDAWAAFSKQDGDTGAAVTLGAPSHVDVTGNVAYIVVPATYTYKRRGKPVIEKASTWTLVVKNTSAGWRITAWAWADGPH